VLNETVKAEIAAAVKANGAIKEALKQFAAQLAKNQTVLATVAKVAVGIVTDAKEDITEAKENLANVVANKWADVQEVKAGFVANITKAQEEVKDHVNEWLKNAAVTNAKVETVEGKANITITLDLDVKVTTAEVKKEIEAGVKVAIAAVTGSKTANVTVTITGPGAKRQAAWQANTQVGPGETQTQQPGPENADGASSVVVGFAVILAAIACFM
jgi:uncharacterized alkaline shock family protein YloU